MIRSSAITAADTILVRSGLSRAIARSYGGQGMALMFHSVVASPRDWLFQDIRYSAQALDSILRFCRQQNIDVISPDEMINRLEANCHNRFVVFTFDDGYKDNLEVVAPIFEKHQAPFSVFVCSHMIENRLDIWWSGLLQLCRDHDRVDFEPLQQRLDCSSLRMKQHSLFKLTRWVEANVLQNAPLLRAVFEKYGINTTTIVAEEALSIQELQTLSRRAGVTIGGHGVSHRPLASLPQSEVIDEVASNKAQLENIVQRPVEHFTFPHGDVRSNGDREANILCHLGFRSAFSTIRGSLFPEHRAAPFLLPRGAMNPRRMGMVHFEAQLHGAHRFMESFGGNSIHPTTLPTISDIEA